MYETSALIGKKKPELGFYWLVKVTSLLMSAEVDRNSTPRSLLINPVSSCVYQ